MSFLYNDYQVLQFYKCKHILLFNDVVFAENNLFVILRLELKIIKHNVTCRKFWQFNTFFTQITRFLVVNGHFPFFMHWTLVHPFECSVFRLKLLLWSQSFCCLATSGVFPNQGGTVSRYHQPRMQGFDHGTLIIR